jgi:hypothetical protein
MIKQKPFNLIIEGLLLIDLILLTIMQIEKYTTENDIDNLVYTFNSIGERTIKKKVEYQRFSKYDLLIKGLPIDAEIYNLAFGDVNEDLSDFSDQITSNNGDMNKVLATVVDTAFNFWEHHPNAIIFFKGSQPEGKEFIRTYLYQKKIERFLGEISDVAYVFGQIEDTLELFNRDKKYNAFLIIQKR